jgi:drug/metabolite transporter (DMT)-like permease
MFGALLAFASAAFFGMNNAAVRRGVIKSTVLQGMAITVPLGVPIFVVFAALFGGFAALADWEVNSWLWMALAGVVHFVIGRYGNYRATQALGATLSTPIQQLSILVALLLSFVFLDETINTVNLFGIALVVVGPIVVLRQRKGSTVNTRAHSGFVPDYLPGFGWGFICALGYGASPLLISLGLGSAGTLSDSVAGVLVSYVAASIVVIALVGMAGGVTYMRTMHRGSGKWFAISAALVALSQVLRYMALAVAPISVVVPVQRLSVVFRIIFNAMLNRDHEIIDRWVIMSIFLAFIGVLALSMNTLVLLNLLHLPLEHSELLARPLF